MNITSRTARLCLEGTRAEFERRSDEARRLYREAWNAALDDCDRAMAAHYLGHAAMYLEGDLASALSWFRVGLDFAYRDERAAAFRGSAHVALGGCYEALGMPEAEREFELAARLGIIHAS